MATGSPFKPMSGPPSSGLPETPLQENGQQPSQTMLPEHAGEKALYGRQMTVIEQLLWWQRWHSHPAEAGAALDAAPARLRAVRTKSFAFMAQSRLGGGCAATGRPPS